MSYIAIDLGGTNVRIAASESLDKGEFSKVEKHAVSGLFEEDFSKILSAIAEVNQNEIQAIGFGLPGTLNAGKDTLVSATNMPGWIGINIRQKLADSFRCPVLLENDAVAAALGEAVYGSGVYPDKERGDQQDFIYITWGTGIGGALVHFKDKIDVQKIYWERYLEDWEQQCGGKQIQMRFGKPADALDDSQWEQVMADCYRHIIRLGKELDVRKFVIGGGIANKQHERLEILAKRLIEYEIQLKMSCLAEEVGLWGALALIQTKVH